MKNLPIIGLIQSLQQNIETWEMCNMVEDIVTEWYLFLHSLQFQMLRHLEESHNIDTTSILTQVDTAKRRSLYVEKDEALYGFIMMCLPGKKVSGELDKFNV